jgi:hypothetical protein
MVTFKLESKCWKDIIKKDCEASMLRCDNFEKAVGTALIKSNSQDVLRAETLASLHHSDTNGFRRNLRSAIREYIFSSNGSMYPDENVK